MLGIRKDRGTSLSVERTAEPALLAPAPTQHNPAPPTQWAYRIGISSALPNVGKSTLFNALSSAKAEAANYPFCTIEPNVGVVVVPDPRLQALDGVVHADKVVPTAINFVDIAGLVRTARTRGEGLGNRSS